MTKRATYTIKPGFPEAQRAQAASLYWEAFGAKLGKVLGPPEKGLAFFADTLNPDFALSAQDANGELLGIAGFKTAQGALSGGGFGALWQHYGLGALWRAPLLSLLERPVQSETLLMDGICVSAKARGTGLGTALLQSIKDEARARGLIQVRLDVIDTNPRARALYLREGFEASGSQSLGPLRHVFGFSHAEEMRYAVPQSDDFPQRSELT